MALPNMTSSLLLTVHTDDKHRVKLLMYPGIEGSDYINATFLDVSLC